MQTAFILVNAMGILLGVYRDKETAMVAMEHFTVEADTIAPLLYLYEVHANQVDKHAANVFQMIYKQ